MVYRVKSNCLEGRAAVGARLVFLTSLFLAVFLSSAISPALANDHVFNINTKRIEIAMSGDDAYVSEYTSTGNPVRTKILPDERIILSGKWTEALDEDDSVVVVDGVTAKIVLRDLDITTNVDNTAAIDIRGGASVDLTLSGENILTAGTNSGALQVSNDSKLLIRGGTEDTLTAKSGANCAGIGGALGGSGGSITIAGGVLTADGGNRGAGIGGGSGNTAGAIGTGGEVTITGGKVTANGGTGGAGIGGGYRTSGGTINITGGTVIAEGGISGAGIGGGDNADGGEIIITGGTITAEGNDDASDIGAGSNGPDEGITTITGGSVRPLSDVISVIPRPKSKAPANLYLNTLTVRDGQFTGKLITACTVDGEEDAYGVNDVYTDDNGKVYLWLPEQVSGDITVSADQKSYGVVFTRTNDDTNKAILPLVSVTPKPDPSTDIEPTSVSLDRHNLNLIVGQTYTLKATIAPTGASNKNVSWESEDPEIADVDASGEVVALAPGRTEITVTTEDGDHTDTCLVMVATEVISIDLSGLNLEDGIMHLTLGESVDIEITSNQPDAVFEAEGLPEGLTLSEDGILTGAAEETGEYHVIVTATLPNDEAAAEMFTLCVDDGEITYTSGRCTTGALGTSSVFILAALAFAARPGKWRGKERN